MATQGKRRAHGACGLNCVACAGVTGLNGTQAESDLQRPEHSPATGLRRQLPSRLPQSDKYPELWACRASLLNRLQLHRTA